MTAQQVIDLLDTQAYFTLMNALTLRPRRPFSTISRSERLIDKTAGRTPSAGWSRLLLARRLADLS